MLSVAAQACLLQMYNTLLARQYSVRSIRNYTQEMRFLFAHYYDLLPESITQHDIINYICFIIKEHGVGTEKCHQIGTVFNSKFILAYFYTTERNANADSSMVVYLV